MSKIIGIDAAPEHNECVIQKLGNEIEQHVDDSYKIFNYN